LGKLDVIEEVLSLADIFLLLSEKESFGLAALEAMACEVPVISSNAGGIPEVNVHGVTGFISEIGDVEDMAKNTIYILEDEERLQTFKSNALDRAKEFDIANILPCMSNIMNKSQQRAGSFLKKCS
jgi:glycosyltransferase involved in cell wall biosynthesis